MLPNPPNFPYGALSLVFHPSLPLNLTTEVSVSPSSILTHHSLQPLRPSRQSHLIVSVIVSVLMCPKFIFQPLMSFRFRQKAQPNGPSHNSPSSMCLKSEWSFPSLSSSCACMLVVPPFMQSLKLFLRKYLWLLDLSQPPVQLITSPCQFYSLVISCLDPCSTMPTGSFPFLCRPPIPPH